MGTGGTRGGNVIDGRPRNPDGSLNTDVSAAQMAKDLTSLGISLLGLNNTVISMLWNSYNNNSGRK